jgi:ribonuclease BN (tRNA processing enzyme)
MKAIFLGTNGWYDTPTGNTPCVLVESDSRYIVFDAGFGFYKVKDTARDDKPISLFISHLHLDHLIGLHTLPLFKAFPQGIDIYVPEKMEKALRGFLRRPFTSAPLTLPVKLRFHAISRTSRPGFDFDMLKLRHSVPCFGYRVTVDGKSVAYCTDTGDCANLKKLASGADLFITECAMAPQDKGPNLFHITPETAAAVARDARAKALALFHFDPGKYPTMEHRRSAEAAAKAIFDRSVAACDGTEITF